MITTPRATKIAKVVSSRSCQSSKEILFQYSPESFLWPMMNEDRQWLRKVYIFHAVCVCVCAFWGFYFFFTWPAEVEAINRKVTEDKVGRTTVVLKGTSRSYLVEEDFSCLCKTDGCDRPRPKKRSRKKEYNDCVPFLEVWDSSEKFAEQRFWPFSLSC